MAHMEEQITQKGALYVVECNRCGDYMHTHEWVNDDHNSRRDAMENGTLRCEHCGTGVADKLTFERLPGKYYAGRYSAPGYLDCTDWIYNCNLRKLKRELRELYGSAD